jgi:membrane associated rhomboid family serine protease
MQWRINIPPLTRILLAFLLGVSSVYQITRFASWTSPGDPDFLGLIPQWSVFHPWVFLTATFAEQNVLTLLIAGGTVLYGGKYLERAWDTREFGKFVLVVTVLPNVAAALIYVLWFAISRDDDRVYVDHTNACGRLEADPVAAGPRSKAPSPCKLRSWWRSSSWCPNTP